MPAGFWVSCSTLAAVFLVSDTAACLHDLTKDDPAPWTDACTESWSSLCSCFAYVTLMHHPDFDRPFHVYFDASLRGIGGLLLQMHLDPNLWPSVRAGCSLQRLLKLSRTL
jgi:hypothetical protein